MEHLQYLLSFEFASSVFFQLNNKVIEKHSISKEQVPFTVPTYGFDKGTSLQDVQIDSTGCSKNLP
jgi:hypothetical protein